MKLIITFHQKRMLKGVTSTKSPVFALFLESMLKALKYLTNMKRLPILLLILVAAVFLAFKTLGSGTSVPPSKYEQILQTVTQLLTQGHFQPQEINDEFSKKIFKISSTEKSNARNKIVAGNFRRRSIRT